MRGKRGFTLIELLIVVAIILIIAAIAIPNLMKSKISANEASAVASVRTIDIAELSYDAQHPEDGFAKELTEMSEVLPPTLLDGEKSGYRFTLSGGGGGFTVTATPISSDQGVDTFCSDQSNVIYVGKGSCMVGQSKPLQ